MNTPTASPSLAIVQVQLGASNAKDIQTLTHPCAPDAEQVTVPGNCWAQGRKQIWAGFLTRLATPDGCAPRLIRTASGNSVVAFALITHDFPKSNGTRERLCSDVLARSHSQCAIFAKGAKRLGWSTHSV